MATSPAARTTDTNLAPSEALAALLDSSVDSKFKKILRHPNAFNLFSALDNEFYFETEGHGGSVLFAGTQKGEGATTVAALFAAYEASYNSDRRVVFLDTDFSANSRSTAFGLAPAEPGLWEVNCGQVKLSEAIQATPLPNLHVIPARGADAKGPFKMANHHLESVLSDLRHQFDVTLVNAEPANSGNGVNAIASMVDRVVLVYRYGGAPREQVNAALTGMRRAGANVLGVVLNRRVHPIPKLFYGLK